jgi:hypothetical protein
MYVMVYFVHVYIAYLHTNLIVFRASPPTSPQRAQLAARQAEREQRQMGSPPGRRQPRSQTQPMPLNMPLALAVSDKNYGTSN